jgi:hypothetical protein
MRRTTRIATALLLLAIPLSLATPAGAVTTVYRSGWSGSTTPGGGYTSVTMQFVVPHVSAACGRDSSVAIFDGLGGWGSLPFVQNGITVTPAGASAWREVFDRNGGGSVVGVPLRVRSGDRVRVSLSFADRAYHLTFRWENLTLHTAYNAAISGAARYYNGATADYVVERPNYPYRGAALGAFDSVTFQDARALRGRRWVADIDHNASLITMVGATGRTLARTSIVRNQVVSRWGACR